MKYDVLIVGAGPAGLSAGIFCMRAGLKVACLESFSAGGQLALTVNINNYPGVGDISGFELANRIKEHAISCGVEIINATVTKLSKTKTGFVAISKNNKFEAPQAIIACGCKLRGLGLPNEKQLTGKGVSYCASCDGGFFKDKVVAVVGGGRTAEEDVHYLSRIAKKIYVINRREVFRAGENALANMKKLKNVQIVAPAQVVELRGDEKLEGIVIDHNGTKKSIKLDGLFIAIGSEPNLNFVDFELETDDNGYIEVDEEMRTSVKNVYACGDIISKNFRQVINACAEGATAGNSCIGDR